MKFLKLIISLIILRNNIYGQTKEISVIDREIIKKNKVYKCLEYDSQDSLTFFKNYKNGLYTIFDTQGRRIEENTYSSGIVDEIKVIYSYNKSGRPYMWYWYQENSIPKISRTRIEKYDSTGKNIGYCEYSPNNNERCDSYDDINYITDTIKSENNSIKQLLYITYANPSKNDTIDKSYDFFQKERLDSNIYFHFENGKIVDKLITKYTYTDNKRIKSEFYRNNDGQTTETNITYYLKNGLPDKMEIVTYYLANKKSKPQIDKRIRKFIYQYWN